jgi:hypothetical protein
VLGLVPHTQINSASDAEDHWSSGAGGAIPAGAALMSIIQSSDGYKKSKKATEDVRRNDLLGVPCGQKTGTLKIKGKTIGFDSNNLSVGNIDVAVLDYDFVWTTVNGNGGCVIKGVGIRQLSFNDTYDFVWDGKKPVKTFFTDTVPGWYAGKGKPFTITGSWTDKIEVEIQRTGCTHP